MIRSRRQGAITDWHRQVVQILSCFGRLSGWKRTRNKLIRGRLIGWGNWQTSCSSDNLRFGPLIIKVVQSTPERGYLALNLWKADVSMVQILWQLGEPTGLPEVVGRSAC